MSAGQLRKINEIMAVIDRLYKKSNAP